MKNETWDNFIQKTQNRKPISYVADAVKLINTKGLKKALDLGCGAGIDAKYLAENDFYVDAVDFSDASIEQTKKICASSKVSVIKSDINEFNIITSSYVLIIAWNSLPFLTKKIREMYYLKFKTAFPIKEYLYLAYSASKMNGQKQSRKCLFGLLKNLKMFYIK